VRRDFSWRRYAMGLLHGTPAAIPRVSAVVPNYNYAALIASRIDNVLGQTLPVYELVVLDDASTDDSIDQIAAALHNVCVPWTLLARASNSGSVFEQWRAGALASRGDIVWIAEADDIAGPQFLESVAAPMLDNDVVLSFCQSQQIDVNGRELAPDYRDYLTLAPTRDWAMSYVAPGAREITECLAIMNTIPNASAVLLRREQLTAVLSDSDALAANPTCGDWLVYLRMAESGSVAYEARVLNSHRRHAESVIGRVQADSHFAEIRTIQRMVAAANPLSADVVHLQADYLAHVRRHFGLES
jgi:O-antigen biosynthesis protein